MKKQTDVEKIKEITSEALNAEGIDAFRMYLFGSRARGDFSSHSDYDIMIVLEKRLAMKKKIKLFTKRGWHPQPIKNLHRKRLQPEQ
ncbi:MAG: nucleotidyltransferase domain-containing protein [Candidatus Aminicenantes bacterium]|nr:MAG: nucleotidyltransferase domain-containing protein [Candidatus Aminicenantes bacterium]